MLLKSCTVHKVRSEKHFAENQRIMNQQHLTRRAFALSFIANPTKRTPMKIRRLLPRVTMLAMFVSAFGGVPADAAEEKPPAVAESVVPDPALEEALKKLKFPGVAINLKEGYVDIEAKICLDRGMLELVVCTNGGKEHESIVAIAARPMHIHTALLLLGAKAGNPAIRRPPSNENERWIDIPPRGCEVDVLLVFPDKAGKPVEHPISEFITRSSAGPEVGRDAAEDKKAELRFPTHTFLFAGSHLVDNGPGPRRYLSDESGHVISIASFGDELLCLSGVHSHQNGALEWQVNAAGLPAVGTKITLRLRPKLKPAVEGNPPNPVRNPPAQ